jgi:cell wall-associated NlpC family hydrolase
VQTEIRSQTIAIARTWIDTPWQHHQRTKGIGVDCVQFLLAVAEELGMEIALKDNYQRTPNGDSLLNAIGTYFAPKQQEELELGDIIVFRFNGVPHHVGLVSQIQDLSPTVTYPVAYIGDRTKTLPSKTSKETVAAVTYGNEVKVNGKDTWFIHASQVDRKVCEVPFKGYWERRAIAYFNLQS